MAQEVRITGYHGINNLLSRDRIKGLPTREDPLVDLSAAQNIDLDDTGKPSVRRGYTLVGLFPGVHSGFSANGLGYCVRLGVLYEFNPAGGFTPLLTLGSDATVRYWSHSDLIWFTNGAVIGEIKDGAARLFAPPTNATEFKEMLPPGQVIAFFRGRLYTGADTLLNMSDDTRLGRMDTEIGFKQFPDYIRLIAPTLDGLYVGTERALFFGQGATLHKMPFVKVANVGVKHIAPVYLDAEYVLDVNAEGVFPLFETLAGVCYGLPGGQVLDLTSERYVPSTGTAGASFLREANGQFHYISAVR